MRNVSIKSKAFKFKRQCWVEDTQSVEECQQDNWDFVHKLNCLEGKTKQINHINRPAES